MPLRRLPVSELLRRLGAAATAALVLALSVLAQAPDLHASLHADHDHAHAGHHHPSDEPHADATCVVTLFAQGVSLPLGVELVVYAPHAWHFAPVQAQEELLLASPRYLRQPERGPPVC